MVAAAAAVAAAVAVAVVVVINMFCTTSRLLLQFHITGRCNLSCKHCYRSEGNVETLSFEDIINVLEQFIALKKKYNTSHGIKRRAHINLTGGEPFFRKDIKEILSYLGSKKEHLTYGILSNGSFIDDEIIALLKETEVSFVQLSLDGDKNTHDFLRAKGDYERVLNKAAELERKGIKTYISFTANRENYKHLPRVAKECRKRKITKLWSDRLVPIGNGEELKNIAITKADMPDYLKTLKKAQGNFLHKIFYRKTQVTMNRALQFKEGGQIYSCSAGDSLITVDEFGNIMPCRRMPIICGNALTDGLTEVYYDNETFKKLRGLDVPNECLGCKFAYLCRGGAKCQSYAEYGSFTLADPACGETKKDV